MIHHDPVTRIFHLRNKAFSYLIGVAADGDLRHLYLGAPLGEPDVAQAAGAWDKALPEYFRELHSREFASFGSNDLRSPALLLEHPDGSRLSFFAYKGHQALAQAPELHGLPQAQGESEALLISLEDPYSGQELTLSYRLFDEVLVRRATLKQREGRCAVRRLCSLSLDLGAGHYEALSLPGFWARERHEQRTAVPQGLLRFESRRGITSHQMAPFIALAPQALQQDQGPTLGLSLLYSGNWLIEAEGQADGTLRLNAGLNDFDFRWDLEEGQSLDGPEVALAWSPSGLNGLSQALHRFVKRHVLDPQWQAHTPPALINSWEAKYFNFNHNDIVAFAESAKGLGADLVVLDDGWFGRRDDDKSSLGDWEDDLRKLPGGIKALAAEVHGMGLKFGLWFEPEMISPKSRLFEQHPDWALWPQGGRHPSTARWQYVLDMGRPDVRDHIFRRMDHYIKDAGLDYIKWDMNRPLWELPSPASAHRYLLGVYELMARLKKSHPGLLIESCAGGGARFDYGILRYHPQIWTSDNTDGLDRLHIQWGSSYFMPPRVMGSHISAVPNHLSGRTTPMAWRAQVALAGCFGLELDPAKLDREDHAEAAKAVAQSRELWPYLRDGDFYRLEDPKGARCAWVFVMPDKRKAALYVFQRQGLGKGRLAPPLSLRGLDPGLSYQLGAGLHQGGALMAQGWVPELPEGDLKSGIFLLEAR